MISEEKVDKVEQIFALFDKDGDGKIPISELPPLLRALNRIPTPTDMATITNKYSSSGCITPSDLSYLLTTIPPIQTDQVKAELIAAFKILDKEGKGRVGSEELKRLVMSVGERMSEGEAEEMIRMGDPERTGFIEYEKFIQKLILL